MNTEPGAVATGSNLRYRTTSMTRSTQASVVFVVRLGIPVAMTRELEDERIPLGYLITFRGYGTWLHGDRRGSVDRFHNRFGTPRIPPNRRWEKHNRETLSHPPVRLGHRQSVAIEKAIRETCKIRK